jgi:outer membrane protein assembly factor BamB
MAIVSHIEPHTDSKSALERKWVFDCKAPVYSDLVTGDINNDGNSEIVLKTCDEELMALSCDGKKLWGFPMDEGSDIHKMFLDDESIAIVTSCPVLADINDDGRDEIIIGSTNGKIYCLTGDGAKLWEFKADGPVHSTAVVADIDGDGKLEVLIGSDDHMVYCLDRNGTRIWSFECALEVQSGIAAEDIDNDGQKEVIFGSNDNKLYALKANGDLCWKYETLGPINGRPQIADIHNDGQKKIIVGSHDGRIYVIKGNGNLEWKYGTHGRIVSEVALADLNFDNKLEIVATSLAQEDNLVVLSNSKDTIGSFTAGFWVAGAPRIADIDKDGNLEIVFGSYDHHLYVLTFKKDLKQYFRGELQQDVMLYDTEGVIIGSPTWLEHNGVLIVTANKQGKVIALKY